MADSLLRLRVESSEYDSKIKRAQQGLLHFEDACRKVGGTLAILEKDEKAYVQSLGQMETVSKTAKGRLSELTTAFTELSMQYKRLTDEEKQGDLGKALSSSLEQLKTRIADTKSQLADTNRELSGTPSLFDQLTSRLTVNIDAVTLFNKGMQAASAVLGVVKDAFFASEANVDEWGRVVDSSRSLYEGFLTSLNTGDISGYLSNIDSIVSAARQAYDEIDRLGTLKTIQTPQKSAQQTENERMRMMIQTGRYIAPVDGRRASMKNGQVLTPEQIRRIETQLENGMKTLVGLVGNEVKQTGKAIDAVYQRQAKELGMSLSEFRKGTSSMAEFDKRMEGYARYQQWEAAHTSQVIDTQTGGANTIRTGGPNPFEEFAKWGTFRVDGDRYNQLVQLITQRDQQAGQVYGMQSQAYRTMNRAEGITVRQIMNGGTSSGGTGTTTKAPAAKEQTELQKNQKLISDLTQEYQALADKAQTASGQELVAADDRMTAIQGEIRVLQERNEELKRWADLAQGKTPQNIDVTHIAAPDPSKMGVKALPLFDYDASKSTGVSQKAVDGLVSQFQQAVQTADIGGALMQKLQTGLTDATTLSTLLKTAIEKGLNTEGMDFAGLKEQIARGIDIPDEKFQELQAKINEQLEKMGIDPINIDFKTGKDVVDNAKQTQKAWSAAAQAITSAGSAMQNIEDPAAQVAGIVMQAIANIALGFSKQSIEAAGGGPFAWIAATLSGLAVMTSTIAQIKSATKGGFAEGGIVPGNSYSGDNLRTSDYGINSGELVLTRAQTNSIAAQLTDGDGRVTANTHPYVNGEQIYLGLTAYLRRSGRGELVMSR